MSSHSAWGSLIGRCLLVALFVPSAFAKITHFGGTVGAMSAKGVPMPALACGISIAVELGAAACIALGWHSRQAALLLIVWMVPVTLLFHAFWAADPAQATMQFQSFMKNVAIAGGMLLLASQGPGPLSIERRGS